jgi:hypothetical protein
MPVTEDTYNGRGNRDRWMDRHELESLEKMIITDSRSWVNESALYNSQPFHNKMMASATVLCFLSRERSELQISLIVSWTSVSSGTSKPTFPLK